MIEHSSVINLVLAQRREFGITADENILLASHISFDASVEQIFIALTSGARLTIIDRETLLDAERFERLIDDGGITHIHLVPGLLKMLTARKYSRLKRVIAGGDKCPKELADSWAGYYTFYNEYGPTETTVTALEWRYDPAADLSFVPIGRPVANTRVYILDGVSLSPVGAVGEICIGGAGVARGYLNRETLTQDKFISNPFLEGDRIYRTGDLGRWTEGGVIEFLGRMDHQVKVRGFRVEPGEIENRLLQYGKFTEACVCVYAGEGKEGQEKLVAYLVAQELPLDIPAIKEYLGRSLPAYMVPSLYIQLQQLPLTPIGKVDRGALPAPEGAVPAATGISGEGSEEANGTRKRLIGIWEEVLGIRHPGTAVNFFDLGATSIDLMVASGKMKKYFNVDDLLVKIFHYPSIDLLAGYIDRVLDGREREGMAGEIIDRANVRNRRQRRRNLNS
jgi:acyl-CoA synthetase (AMP-forming)/AMP-acid ligase II